MNKIIGIAALLLIIPLAQAADSEPAPPRDDALRDGFYVSPMFVYTKVDQKRKTGDGSGFGLGLGYRWHFVALELGGEFSKLSAESGGSEAKLNSVGLTALVTPLQNLPWVGDLFRDVYALVGFGASHRENHPGFSKNDTTVRIDAGAGYMLPLQLYGFDFALRAEGLYRFDTQQPPFAQPASANDPPKDFSDLVGRIGVYFPIGHKPPPLPPPAPEPVKVVPVDSDHDGVFDPSDQCPDTPAGSTVDANGCPPPKLKAGDVVVLQGVNFETDSAVLKPEAIVILDPAVAELLRQPALKVAISGHTDSTGSLENNQKLSEQRADAVRDYLVSLGIAAERLHAAGFGETAPLDGNDTPEGRARNRRVELKIVE